MSKRVLIGSAAVVALLTVTVLSFLAIRSLTDQDDEVGEANGAGQTSPNNALRTPPQGVLGERVINGIRVGSAVSNGEVEPCLTPENMARELTFKETLGSPLDFSPTYLPQGVEFLQGRGSACGEAIVFVEKEYLVSPSSGTGGQSRSGGVISVRRILQPNDRIQIIGPAEDFESVTVSGKPGVMLRPSTFQNGAADSPGTIAIQEPAGGFTVVQGSGLPWEEVIKLAEGLQ